MGARKNPVKQLQKRNRTTSRKVRILKLKERVDRKLSVLVLTFEPTANAVSSASAAYSRFYGFKGQPQVLEKLTKYGPPFISFAVMKVVKDRIGIGELNRLNARRLKARAKKDWRESDRIRDELAAMGMVLKDSRDGTTWEIAR